MAQDIVLIIPGNPSISNYYQRWIAEMQHKLPEAEFIYAPYPFLDGVNCPKDYMSQITGFFKDKISDYEDHQITIIGHSIGAYFGARIKELRKDITYIGLFPFLGKRSLSADLTLQFAKFINKQKDLQKLIFNMRFVFYKKFPGFKNIDLEEIQNSIHLGAIEKQYFSKGNKLSLNHHPTEFNIVYTDGDKWCPPNMLRDIESFSNLHKLDSKHDFIIYPDERKKVSEAIMKIIKES
jgi:hypothetical protein